MLSQKPFLVMTPSVGLIALRERIALLRVPVDADQ
jgi:hypothetical protein